ncbi:MAG: amino acid adenylation domain-containing protein [Magnetococcus sp. YQC-3]
MSVAPETNIAHWFHRSAHRHASRPALWLDGCHTSYSDLLQRVQQLAATLERLDPEPDNPVAAVFAYRSLTAYAAVLAVLYTGKGYLPLNPTFPVARTLHVADLAECAVLILDAHCAEQAQEFLEKVQKSLTVLLPDHAALPPWTQPLSRHRFFCQEEISRTSPQRQTPKEREESLAYLLFTSGSTGIPKGVMVSSANVNAFVASMLERYRPTPDDRFSQHSDMTFDASVYDMFVCWAAGACLYPIPQPLRMAPAQFIKEQALTFWESVPSVIQFMKRMYLLKPGAFPSLRWAIFGGEQLTREAVQLWQVAAPNAQIENTYGPTEGTICITGHIWQPGLSDALCSQGAVPIGTPYPGQTAAMLIDGQLQPPAEGLKGELCLSGSQITPGYWQNRTETDRCYLEMADEEGSRRRWYKTGDLVSWKEGVGFYYVDRVDRQLKIRGYRVELSEIEHCLRQVAGTDQVAVVGWPAEGKNVTGIVGFICGSKRPDEEILEECAKRLPPYMVPRQLRRLAQLPLNANGKTDMLNLLQRLDSEQGKKPAP